VYAVYAWLLHILTPVGRTKEVRAYGAISSVVSAVRCRWRMFLLRPLKLQGDSRVSVLRKDVLLPCSVQAHKKVCPPAVRTCCSFAQHKLQITSHCTSDNANYKPLYQWQCNYWNCV
jgi:hypothetical protein